MGRQLNFLLSKNDQSELLTSLVSRFDLVGCNNPKSPIQTPDDPVSYAGLPPEKMFQPCILRKSDFQSVVFAKHPLPERGYDVDIFLSPAIQFSPPTTRNGCMAPGRFYYLTSYLDESGWCQKPDSFIKFAEALFRATKKFCIKERWTEHLGEFIGPDAARLHKEGLKFIPFF